MRFGALTLIALLALPPGSAAAGSYPFLLHNFSGSDVTGVSVKNGKVVGFKRILSKNSRSFTISVPDGVCVSRVRIKLSSGRSLDDPTYDICSGSGITVIGP